MQPNHFNSKFLTVMFAAAIGGFLFGACSSDDGKGPPVFNAIDPSLQCPAGQVGWDFTTGGNESDVLVQPVGSEIKIQEVKYSCLGVTNGDAKDLTASFRAQCDNAKACERRS